MVVLVVMRGMMWFFFIFWCDFNFSRLMVGWFFSFRLRGEGVMMVLLWWLMLKLLVLLVM